jgi:hypothetical protein
MDNNDEYKEEQEFKDTFVRHGITGDGNCKKSSKPLGTYK